MSQHVTLLKVGCACNMHEDDKRSQILAEHLVKRPLERHMHRCDIKEIRCEGVGRIQLARKGNSEGLLWK